MIAIHKPTMIKLGNVNPVAYNPRRITLSKFEALKRSISDNGFVHPLVIQKEGNRLIGGHQRRRALLELLGEGALESKVPCIVLDVDDSKAKLLNIALNNTEGEFDTDLLARVIESVVPEIPLDSEAWLSTGFTSNEIERLLQPVPLPSEDEEGDFEIRPFASSVTLSIAFDSVAERDAVKGLLAEISSKTGKKSGSIVRELLDRDRGGK